MANAFFVRCDCRNRRFTGGKSRFLQEADGRKGIASAANELCGSAFHSLQATQTKGAPCKRLQQQAKQTTLLISKYFVSDSTIPYGQEFVNIGRSRRICLREYFCVKVT